MRRNEILATLNEDAVRLYFQRFQPGNTESPPNAIKAFEDFYARQFGRGKFVIPIGLLAGIAGTLLCWSANSAIDLLDGTTIKPGHLPTFAVLAIMGGYMYCLSDVIERLSSSSISPSHLLELSFRLVVAVPMASALASAFDPALGLPIAFLLGAFPTKTVLTIARRFMAKRLNVGDLPESGDSELLKLNGIDLRIAECFAAEGYTTVLQLAYADPIRLTIKTNLGFSFITDCVSQALLYIYAGERFQDFTKASLRGSFEVRDIYLALESKDPDKVQKAKATYDAIVKQLNYDSSVLMNLFRQVGLDPYTEFIYEAWAR